MSQENVDAILCANRALKEGDLETALDLFAPEAIYYEPAGTPMDTGDVLRGRDQIRESISAYLTEFPDFHSEIDELLESGEVVICVQRWVGTGRSSGARVELTEVIVYRFENGTAIEARVVPSRAEALEAVGLSE